ncbi:ribonuclease J [Tistlia consotensis]|uniref:Ribonuclease J n=1 Tax=Tistlia consotensis USBA 355 TaxID=560819 RepID=A0A1Y6BWZ3_9PROT|nr:ribonuclease J [Tistlia consotensis]SMF25186.1 ribonuclease J [Tistlia consotensis USBA 355]SNR59882.1 ribonuclease J [Tistlia consotensis]
MTALPRRPAEPGPDELLFVPLGGTGEIGMNLNLYGHAGKWLMVDCGVAFGEHDLPGIEVVLPDPDFVFERRDDLVGILLTHAHEDHLGALPYVWPELDCPVYATPFTAALLRRKLRDDGVRQPAELIEVPLSGRLSIGPFEVELVTLTHSIPEPNAVLLHTKCGTVFHTGDWKLDSDPLIGESYDVERLRRLAGESVLAMVCDSTNALVPGSSGSELDVREALDKVIGAQTGRVAVACFASNVARLETVTTVAESHGRRVALVGRSMHRIVAAAREAGYLADLPPFIDVRDAGYLPREEVLLLCTGSQGEPRAALWRIANDDHPEINLAEGDSVVFSSRVIPGNEKSIFALYNALSRRGIKVISDHESPGIHVSGHPCRDELTQMYQWVRPRIAVPVHGEARHMAAQAELARVCQVPEVVLAENGAVVRLAPGKAEIVDHVHAGRMVVDGTSLRTTDSPVLRQRRRMVREGSAVVGVVVDSHGDLLSEPRIAAAGLFDREEEPEVEEAAVEAAEDAVHRASRHDRRDDAALGEAVRLAVRRALQRELGRKPVVEVQLIRLED